MCRYSHINGFNLFGSNATKTPFGLSTRNTSRAHRDGSGR